jgi:hypothetical protein
MERDRVVHAISCGSCWLPAPCLHCSHSALGSTVFCDAWGRGLAREPRREVQWWWSKATGRRLLLCLACLLGGGAWGHGALLFSQVPVLVRIAWNTGEAKGMEWSGMVGTLRLLRGVDLQCLPSMPALPCLPSKQGRYARAMHPHRSLLPMHCRAKHATHAGQTQARSGRPWARAGCAYARGACHPLSRSGDTLLRPCLRANRRTRPGCASSRAAPARSPCSLRRGAVAPVREPGVSSERARMHAHCVCGTSAALCQLRAPLSIRTPGCTVYASSRRTHAHACRTHPPTTTVEREVAGRRAAGVPCASDDEDVETGGGGGNRTMHRETQIYYGAARPRPPVGRPYGPGDINGDVRCVACCCAGHNAVCTTGSRAWMVRSERQQQDLWCGAFLDRLCCICVPRLGFVFFDQGVRLRV